MNIQTPSAREGNEKTKAVSITVKESQVEELERRAKQTNRNRSWIVRDALDLYFDSVPA